jgi:hypothetical protein
VPLFTGFMYAAIGSYIARAWRLFDFRFTHHPPLWALVLLAVGIYVNFFTHHYVIDARILLFALTALLFARCWVHFKVWQVHRRMPLLVGFALVALFIWFAENIGTFTAAWIYPHQRHAWSVVSLGKLGAWYLLMIISYVLVAFVNRPQPMLTASKASNETMPSGAIGLRPQVLSGRVPLDRLAVAVHLAGKHQAVRTSWISASRAGRQSSARPPKGSARAAPRRSPARASTSRSARGARKP